MLKFLTLMPQNKVITVQEIHFNGLTHLERTAVVPWSMLMITGFPVITCYYKLTSDFFSAAAAVLVRTDKVLMAGLPF